MEIKAMTNKIICGNSLKIMEDMPSDSVNLIITSPPYFGCRVYGEETLGREEHPLDYIDNMMLFANEMKRILHPEGSLYMVIGDVYFGSKGFSRNKGKWSRKTDHHYKEHKIVKPDGRYVQNKQLLLLPSRLAASMQNKGWVLRNDIIWEKPNPIPSFAKDRRLPVYEHIFHFVKSQSYYFDYDKAKELKHHRDVIRSGIEPYKDHQATFPESLIEPFIQITSKKGDIVFDPFMGSGTVAVVANRNKRKYVGIELHEEYCKIAKERIEDSVNCIAPAKEKQEGSLFDEPSPEKKPKRAYKKRNIPYTLTCCVCKEPKKTNPPNFLRQLEKSGMEKEEFIENYVCRRCRTCSND